METYIKDPNLFTAASNLLDDTNPEVSSLAGVKPSCWFCGNPQHPRSICSAREVICHKFSKKGHFAKLCNSSSSVLKSSTDVMFSPTLATTHSPATNSPFLVNTEINIQGWTCNALIDMAAMAKVLSIMTLLES